MLLIISLFNDNLRAFSVERKTGLEPATLSLGS